MFSLFTKEGKGNPFVFVVYITFLVIFFTISLFLEVFILGIVHKLQRKEYKIF